MARYSTTTARFLRVAVTPHAHTDKGWEGEGGWVGLRHGECCQSQWVMERSAKGQNGRCTLVGQRVKCTILLA